MKGHTIRQVLSGSVFLNFHHLHPEFQKFILQRIQSHYCSKKDIQSDVTFFMFMSVSVLSHPIHTAGLFCNQFSLPGFFFYSSSCRPLCLFFGGLALVALLHISRTTQPFPNPSFSDAVQFFLHIINTDAYSEFDMKASLYSHFEQLLGTPVKPLLLTDNNFATKVNPSRKYPECDIDTGNLFDADGDPIFHPQAPVSPEASALPSEETKPKQKTGSSLKRTLGASSAKRSRSKKLPPADQNTVVVENVQPSVEVPPPAPAAAPAGVISKPAQKQLARPYSYPSLMALPSKLAILSNEHDRSFLELTFLPVSDLTAYWT